MFYSTKHFTNAIAFNLYSSVVQYEETGSKKLNNLLHDFQIGGVLTQNPNL